MAQFAGSTAVTTGAGASTQGLLISSNPSISTPSSTLLRHLPAVSVTSSLVCPRTSSSSCCDNGRPLVTDPLTGQSVCACQLDANSAAASAMFLGLSTRLGPPGPPGPPPPPHPPGLGTPHPSLGLGLGLYGAYAAAAAAAAASAPGDQSQLYAASAGGHDLKDTLALNGGAGSGPGGPGLWPYPAASMYYPYDPSLAAAAYPFAGYGMDLNGARRKNATRETTATLKAWLSEHKKNPYPTKGEKIMLAIITKMTLTQVSTWFANARRRLKKENKMTWEPKNRNDDEDDDSDAGESDDTRKDKSTPDCPRSDMTIHRSVNEWSSEMSSNKSPSPSSEDGDHRHDESRSGDINVDSDSEELDLLSSDSCMSPSEARSADTLASLPTQKPKIWSLADMANVPSQSPATTATAVATGGKMTLPRVPMDSPYARGPAYRGYPPLDPRIYYAARATAAAAAAAATTGHLDTTTPAGKLIGNSPVENLEKLAAMANRSEKC